MSIFQIWLITLYICEPNIIYNLNPCTNTLLTLFTVMAISYLVGEVLAVVLLFSSKVHVKELNAVYLFASV
jgi:hypothetical protein